MMPEADAAKANAFRLFRLASRYPRGWGGVVVLIPDILLKARPYVRDNYGALTNRKKTWNSARCGHQYRERSCSSNPDLCKDQM